MACHLLAQPRFVLRIHAPPRPATIPSHLVRRSQTVTGFARPDWVLERLVEPVDGFGVSYADRGDWGLRRLAQGADDLSGGWVTSPARRTMDRQPAGPHSPRALRGCDHQAPALASWRVQARVRAGTGADRASHKFNVEENDDNGGRGADQRGRC